DAIRREIARVRKAEPLILQDANANAPLTPSDDRLNGTLFDLDRPRLGLTEKHLAGRADRFERIESQIDCRLVGEPFAHMAAPTGRRGLARGWGRGLAPRSPPVAPVSCVARRGVAHSGTRRSR